MLGLLLELAGGALLSWADERRRARKREGSAARGERVGFPACVLGDRPYCRNLSLVHLWLSGPTLHVTPTKFPELHPSRIPALGLVRVRHRDRHADSRLVQFSWEVAECRDGDRTVLIGCSPDSMRLLRAALAGADG
ncbi:hypothetical protein EF910_12245 [Streptomyces sp. WAC07149]|uniref:hypothetical protein n=1 Tax=Streptomyces sp. WAC07149 TaxID=2487425 RepID=UPI000F79785F|nr:hypothetical protein [Streptomyces sp. WAC07149]RST05914.1 hypothetical protein EF910_12245 [Streptomyces sp. WAC07149]